MLKPNWNDIFRGTVPSGSQAACVEVWVLHDEHGRVYSTHRARTEKDTSTIMQWRGQGIEQKSFALLTEAVREEAFLQVLLKLTKDPGFLSKITDTDYENLSVELRVVLDKLVAEIAQQAIQEQVDVMVRSVAVGTS